MRVPEAAVHEDSQAMFRQNYIRFARQILAMKPKSVSHRMQ
jgi:hypothetical protein